MGDPVAPEATSPSRADVRAKARENLEAALRLLDRGLVNAAASRLYFAVFQATVHALVKGTGSPAEVQRGARAWSHGRVADEVAGIRGRGEDHDLFQKLRIVREMADYDRDSVPRHEIEYLRRDAERFVGDLTS